jgi:hypothetical protein
VGADGALHRLLEEVLAFVTRFVSFPSTESAVAVALWIVHTHVFEKFDSTPRLVLASAEKQSGKTRCLEVIDLLARRPIQVTDPSAAAVFRSLKSEPRTLLLDECDNYLDPDGRRDSADLRALINTGHRANGKTMRCAANSHEPEEYPTFCPVALAGLGRLPDTVLDRAVRIAMKRRAAGENVERLRQRRIAPEAQALHDEIRHWVERHPDAFEGVDPELPDEISDRAQDVWEPLVAIADEAGGAWPTAARQAAVILSAAQVAPGQSLGVRLLADLWTIYGDTDAVFLRTEDVLARLQSDDTSPWADGGITSRRLANLLRPFDIQAIQHRDGKGNHRGYRVADLRDAWRRYLPRGATAATSATGVIDLSARRRRKKLPQHRAG